MKKPKIVFFGNGKLAEVALAVLSEACEVVFHARTKEDLIRVKEIMDGEDGKGVKADGSGVNGDGMQNGEKIYGVLASYGQILRDDVMSLFEPEGILNIHPSLLPKYRGAAPIEAAMLDGAEEFGVSVMKIVKEMDAGPVYWQKTVKFTPEAEKWEIYEKLGQAGAEFIVKMLNGLMRGEKFLAVGQVGEATFTRKFDTGMAKMDFMNKTAGVLAREVRAFMGFPKSRMEIFQKDCIVTRVRVVNLDEEGLEPCKGGDFAEVGKTGREEGKNGSEASDDGGRGDSDGGVTGDLCGRGVFIRKKRLFLSCAERSVLEILRLQPAGKREMDARAFINGYVK